MAEVVEKTFSNLVPLLILLLCVFGVLILAAVLLRGRIRRDAAEGVVRRSDSGVDMKSGDVGIVLGRTFHVQKTVTLEALGGSSLWIGLEREDGPSRLLLRSDKSLAAYFPGQGEAPGTEFPESIQREEGSFARSFGPLQLGEDWKLAGYQGPAERYLAIEAQGGKTVLWRGKSIPVEGVNVLKEKDKKTKN